MLPGSSNRHHGVPRSFSGSNDGLLNLTTMDCDEHAYFHRWAGHLPPCFLQRKYVLSSADWQNAAGAGLPVEFVRDALAQLMNGEDWRRSYVDGALQKPVHYGTAAEYFALASIHLNNALAEEAFMTADAIKWLTDGQHLKPASQAFRNDAGAFFGEEKPSEVMRRYLTVRTGNGDFKWTKPMKSMVRNSLVRTARSVKPEIIRPKERNKLIMILEEHRDRLFTCVNVWEPNASDYEQERKVHSHVPFISSIRRKSA